MTEEQLKEKRSLCFWNLKRHAGEDGCQVPIESCEICKADKTMPLGLEAIVEKGFRGIKNYQQKKGVKYGTP